MSYVKEAIAEPSVALDILKRARSLRETDIIRLIFVDSFLYEFKSCLDIYSGFVRNCHSLRTTMGKILPKCTEIQIHNTSTKMYFIKTATTI